MGKTEQKFAHTPNEQGKWHDLEEHLKEVGRTASSFGSKFNGSNLCHLAGLLHDLGKYHTEFQEYLKNCDLAKRQGKKSLLKVKGTDHKKEGALYSKKINELLPFVITGHHGGIPSKADLKSRLTQVQNDEKIRAYADKLLLHFDKVDEISQEYSHCLDPLSTEFFIRMIFSTLVDADFLDTESHFRQEFYKQRGFDATVKDLWERFEMSQNALMQNNKRTINILRNEVFQACLLASEKQQGFFRLTVPTGGGKTRSAMAFALKHAIKHKLERIIVAIPYTSIIEQTAQTYRKIFGQEHVIEHHSSVSFSVDCNNPFEAQIRARLASENWDAPIIVTTTVQLFESLFSNKPSHCRKLHNIARSVIILDEVQTLPTRLLCPILDVLRKLINDYSVSVVLCTATQPALDASPYLEGLTNVVEIAPNPQNMFSELKRVNIEVKLDQLWSWKRVAQQMQSKKQALCIVNTKKSVLSMLDELSSNDVFHLSTLLCGAHRRDILKEVRQRLKNKKPCYLVSTQVIEAGIDIDFPFVLRAMCPLDRIVQAAGRCNREDRMKNLGHVIVFTPAEETLPQGEYRSATQTAKTILQSGDCDLNSPSVFTKYFEALYQTVDLDAERIQEMRKHFLYDEVAKHFRLIKDDSVPIVVRYKQNEQRDDVIESLSTRKGSGRRLLRFLQPYIVNVHRTKVLRFAKDALVQELIPGLWEWIGKYDEERGIVPKNCDPEELIV